MDKIEAYKIIFSDLVRKNIIIPYYQRPYVWDNERVKILLEDLDEQLSAKSRYLLGSLILYDNDGEIQVVDGQQRLVSLALILRVLGESDFLHSSEFAHSQSKAHIKDNYDFIHAWFEARQIDKQLFLQNLYKKVEFIFVKAPNLDDAFIFFDSANAKGKRLEGYDLIKAFHLRALESKKTQAKDSKSSIEFAKAFERLAANGENLKILFNETLSPARQWLRHNSNKVSMDIYNEFCKETPLKSMPLKAKDSLGILQNFVGGADFFEYISHFHAIYEKLRSIEFYKEIEAINWSNGFIYNRYIYIMAVLIYLDKFPNGRVDYMLCLIARAVFTLRCSEGRIYKESARDFAKEILPLIYYASFEQEIENELEQFIFHYMANEKKLCETLQGKKKEIGGGGESYLKIAEKWYGESIPKHYKQGNNNE